MVVQVRRYRETDLPAMRRIWNEVVKEGVAFPQDEPLSEAGAAVFFAEQTVSAVAEETETGTVWGLYILHPNNVGRCGHIANASYAVSRAARGHHLGELLVRDSLQTAVECGFRILQFNAVVASNGAARRLYEKLGFVPLGVIPQGFRRDGGVYEDIVPYYHTLP